MTKLHNPSDHIGKKIARLLIVEYVGERKVESGRLRKVHLYRCACDCGNERIIKFYSLVKKQPTQSCGCLNLEKIKNISFKHGRQGTPVFNAWDSMKQRCLNPRCRNWIYYGGRGIKVCDRWLKSFQNFLDDMGEKPSKEYSLDRIDVNGNYEPSNCKWATPIEQSNNRRTIKKYNCFGFVGSLSEICRHFNVSFPVTNHRVKAGMDVETAVLTPSKKYRKKNELSLCKI